MISWNLQSYILFIYLGFYVAFNILQVISQRVAGTAEETSTYSSSGFCTVNCRPMTSNYQLSRLRLCREPNPGLRGGRRECNHSATVAPLQSYKQVTRCLCVCHKFGNLVSEEREIENGWDSVKSAHAHSYTASSHQ